MAEESRNLAVVLFCGIPGSGKTTLAKRLREYIQKVKGNNVHVIHVCFDELIPSDLEVNPAGLSEESQERANEERLHSNDDVLFLKGYGNPSKYTLWKAYRKSILEAVGKVLFMIRTKSTEAGSFEFGLHGDFETEMEDLPLFKERWRTFQETISREDRNCPCSANDTWRWSVEPHLILVDDNMFYHSMRYEYVQLARKYCAGFAEVYLECPLEIAEKRNRLRSSNLVTSDTIKTMITKMEPPEPSKLPWEQYSLTINASKELEIGTMESIMLLLEEALKHPIPPIVEENLEEKEISRVACLTSITHQADQLLRKYIAGVMGEAKGSGKGKKQLQLLANQLNRKRKEFLDDLRNIKCHSECMSETNRAVSEHRMDVTLSTEIHNTSATKEINICSDVGDAKRCSSSTIVQERNLDYEGILGQDGDQNLDPPSLSGNPGFCMCLTCLPDVQDTEKFKSFVEKMFKDKISS